MMKSALLYILSLKNRTDQIIIVVDISSVVLIKPQFYCSSKYSSGYFNLMNCLHLFIY